MIIKDLLKFKEWVLDNVSEQVAIESTGNLLISVASGSRGLDFILFTHACRIKHIPGKKTDHSIQAKKEGKVGVGARKQNAGTVEAIDLTL